MRRWRLSTQPRVAQSLLKGSDPHSHLWIVRGERHQYTYALHRSSICCALTASGHAAPAPPSSVMKSRRDLFQAARPHRLQEALYRRRGGVVVAVLGSANCSACSGSIRPEPKLSSRSPGESRLALRVRMRRMSAGVSLGLRSSSSATMPLTSAAATEVPVVIWYSPSGAGTRMSTPGADTEMYLPRLAPVNSLSSASVAVTAITLGSAPG